MEQHQLVKHTSVLWWHPLWDMITNCHNICMWPISILKFLCKDLPEWLFGDCVIQFCQSR